MVYDKFPEKAREIAGIDVVGVVSAVNTTAVSFSGAKPLKKYFDGTKQVQLTLQITGMGAVNEQKALIGKLCGILDALKNGRWDIEGITQPKCSIANFPVPTIKNEHCWIYVCSVNIKFYTKEDI